MKSPLALIFLACSAFAQNPALIPHAEDACGPTKEQFQVKTDGAQQPDPQVESGKALIYVAEDQKFKGFKDATARIGLDGAWMGATRGNSYLFFSVEPGEHHLCADWVPTLVGRGVSLFGFTAEPGKTYYFRARTLGGPASMGDRNSFDDVATIDLDLVNSDEGKLLVASFPYSVSHPKK
jgi:hypothetical protein